MTDARSVKVNKIKEKAIVELESGERKFTSDKLKQEYGDALKVQFEGYQISRLYEKYIIKKRSRVGQADEVRDFELGIIKSIFAGAGMDPENKNLKLSMNRNHIKDITNKESLSR